MWHCANSSFENLHLYGNSDEDQVADYDAGGLNIGTHNVGLLVEAGINNTFTDIDIRGQGAGNTAGVTKYLGIGLRVALGFNNAIMTTTTWNKIYVHYCKTGVQHKTNSDFYGLILEAMTIRPLIASSGAAGLYDTLRMENTTPDFAMQLQHVNHNIIFRRSTINVGAKEQFIIAQGATGFVFDTCNFVTSDGTPFILDNASIPNIQARFRQCTFPTGALLVESQASQSAGWDNAKITDMAVVKYDFYVAAVAQSRGEAVMETLGTTGGNHTLYTMPDDGNVLGFTTTYKGNVYAGTYGIDVFVGGVSALNFGGLVTDHNLKFNYLAYRFDASDVLEVKLETNGSFPSGAGDMLVEVWVALGRDGTS